MSYGSFAQFYDLLTDNVDYIKYAKRIDRLARHFASELSQDHHVRLLDLGCGTASLTFQLEKLGYRCAGVDLSQDMLSVAFAKKQELRSAVELINQDMTRFALPYQVGVCVSALDSLNHLGGLSDLKMTFHRVGKYLKEGGVFIFDMNTPYKHACVLKDNCFVYERGEVFCVWQNFYHAANCSVDISLDFFIPSGRKYIRKSESFLERAYHPGIIFKLLKDSGLKPVAAFDSLSDHLPSTKTERILYVAKKEKL